MDRRLGNARVPFAVTDPPVSAKSPALTVLGDKKQVGTAESIAIDDLRRGTLRDAASPGDEQVLDGMERAEIVEDTERNQGRHAQTRKQGEQLRAEAHEAVSRETTLP